jgi:histidyl-tRNA synthetase
MKFQPPRGMRDIEPEDMAKQEFVYSRIKDILLRYGFQLVEPTALENFETVAAKAGPDIEKEIYTFSDKSKRKIALRFDLTVGLARMVASSNYPRPIKLACISNMWRYDRPQFARYREFWQWDIEIFGCKGEEADAEIIAITCDILDSFGLDYEIRVSNRKLVEGILIDAGIKKKDLLPVMRIIDKSSKITEKELVNELKKYTDKTAIAKLGKIKSPDEIKGKNELIAKGKEELKNLFSALENYGKADKCIIDLSIVRGFDYYTGIVYEAWVNGDEKLGAIAGGGRFDDLTGLYGNPMPATGVAGGIERLMLSLKNLKAEKTPEVLVVYIKDFEKAMEIVQELRKNRISASIDLNKRGLSKQLDYANKIAVRFTVIVGPEELKKGRVKLRDMKSGEEKEVEINKLAVALQKNSFA